MPTVLIVDDSPLIAEALTEPFEAAGYLVQTAGSGAEATARLAGVPPDVVVLDVVLPDVSGFELLVSIRRSMATRDLPVVVITGTDDRSAMLQAFRMGADDFLFKPPDPVELLERCRVAIERRAAARAAAPASVRQVLVRRDLAVLCCDVRGFTRVVADRDPETMVQVLNGLFEVLVADVARAGGTVDKFMGDGMLALFGAHESGGQNELRAIRAALDMVQSARRYGEESLTLARPIDLGVGISSGMSVVGLVGARARFEVTAIGDPVNLASRLQALAQEGEVLVDGATWQRVSRAVSGGPGRAEPIKGFGTREVVPVTEIRGEGWFY